MPSGETGSIDSAGFFVGLLYRLDALRKSGGCCRHRIVPAVP
jgi:hypothetical protein